MNPVSRATPAPRPQMESQALDRESPLAAAISMRTDSQLNSQVNSPLGERPPKRPRTVQHGGAPQADSRVSPKHAGLDELDLASMGDERLHARPETNSPVPDEIALDVLADDSRQLAELGYTENQIDRVYPEARAALLAHHATLTELGFHSAQILKVSSRPEALHMLASTAAPLQILLPALSNDDFVAIAKRRGGDLALSELLDIAMTSDVMLPPLSLSAKQLAKIAATGERQALRAVRTMGAALVEIHGLNAAQISGIASHSGSRQSLEAIERLMPSLRRDFDLTSAQVVAIAKHNGGRQTLEAVHAMLPELVAEPFLLTTKDVVAVASNVGGKHALEAIKRLLPKFCEDYKLTTQDVLNVASRIGGGLALEAIDRLLPELCADHAITPQQVVELAAHGGGRKALESFRDLGSTLRNDFGFTTAQVLNMAKGDGGRQKLYGVMRLNPVICNQLGLTTDQVAAIASRRCGVQTMETVIELLPQLRDGFDFTIAQVVAIANHRRGGEALKATLRLLPSLRGEWNLTNAQVVAIASDATAGKSVMTMQRLLTRLCAAPYFWTIEEVLDLAGHRDSPKTLPAFDLVLAAMEIDPNDPVSVEFDHLAQMLDQSSH